MKFRRDIEWFGNIHIPVLSDKQLTATYNATSWTQLNKTWRISMFLTFPQNKKPVEMPSVTLSFK